MIELEYEMTCAETIEGPLGPTTGSVVGERITRHPDPFDRGPAPVDQPVHHGPREAQLLHEMGDGR